MALVIYLVFAVVGMQLFSGKFWRCSDGSVEGVEHCVGNYTADGVPRPRHWRNANQNFDNFFVAMLTLFEV